MSLQSKPSHRNKVASASIRCLMLISLVIGFAVGCDPSRGAQSLGTTSPAKEGSVPPAPQTTISQPQTRSLEAQVPGISNLLRVSDRIYSGSQPEGESAFVGLKELGIQTIVSVDGASPQVSLARQHGLRYVHIPIGYDGIPQFASDSLTRVVRESEGPIYIHCHHGKHRGPAAAAVALIASGGASGEQARQILELAGTGRNYSGLWRDVEKFIPPEPNASLPELVETAQVASLVKVMADIDHRFDRVKAFRKQGWKTSPENPELRVLGELLLIKEAFAETHRHLSSEFDESFGTFLQASEAATDDLMAAAEAQDAAKPEECFLRLEKMCQRCHRQYRDQ